jgi:hypothetical protein
VEHAEVQQIFTAGGTIGHFQSRQTMARLIRWRPIIAHLGSRLD